MQITRLALYFTAVATAVNVAATGDDVNAAGCAPVPVTATTQLFVCSNTVVRVAHLPDGATSFARKLSLIVDPANWAPAAATRNYTVAKGAGGNVTVTTAAGLRVTADGATGAVAFADARTGRTLLAEGARAFTPVDDMGAPSHALRQSWEFQTKQGDEALYGGGEFQNGFVNYRTAPIQLIQFNTEAIVPFFASSRGYGLLWDQYALSFLNDATAESKPAIGTTFTTGAAGDYYFYVDGCPAGGYGCGMDKVVNLTLTDPHGARTVVQSWNGLTNLPNSITGRAPKLAARTTYAVELATVGLQAPKLYARGPDDAAHMTLSSALGEMIDYYFAYDAGTPTLDGAVAGFRAATGAAPLYTRKSYGFWQCKEHYHNRSELLGAARGFRARRIPVDSIVQDWHYWGSEGWGPHWDPSIYPDPASMVAELHTLHFQFMVSVWSRFDPQTVFTKNMTAIGGMINGTEYYDAYNPRARELFYQFSKTAHFDIGVDALWLDATEPEGFPNKGRMLHLASGDALANPYSLETTRAISEGLRRDFPLRQGARVFSLTRSSFAAQQTHGAALWSGDIKSAWDSLRRQVAASTNYQLSGNPYWSEDIGGFFRPANQYTDPGYLKMLTRWFQFGAFTPIFRVHGGGSNTELWNYGNATMAHINGTAIALRYRLLPYTYSGFHRVETRHYTMQRGLAFDFASDGVARDVADAFMYGPAFLVAPLVTPSDTRLVYLPATPGGWHDFFDGGAVAFPTGEAAFVETTRGITQLPLYVRAGSVVPLGPVVQWADAQPAADPLEVRVYTGADGAFALFEDDGKSADYRAPKNAYAAIAFAWDEAAGTLSIGARTGNGYAGMPSARTIHVVFVDGTSKRCAGIAPCKPDATVTYTGAAVTVKRPAA